MRLLSTVLLVGIYGILAACGVDNALVLRHASTSDPTDATTLAAAQLGAIGNNALGAALLAKLTSTYKCSGDAKCAANVLIAPVGISSTLAMLAAGAEGQTAAELTKALGFPTADALANGYGALNMALAHFDAPGPVLASANRVWAASGVPILQTYKDTISRAYQADVGIVDFVGHPASSIDAINQWVAGKTKGTIKDMLSQVDPSTQLILTNALYFHGTWKEAFASDLTVTAPFHATHHDVNARMMTQTNRLGFASTDQLQVVELPYAAGSLVLDVILPAKSGDEPWTADGFGEALHQSLTQLAPRLITVHLPTFTSKADVSLAQALEKMGVATAFGETADFSGITGKAEGLALADVLHRTFINVTELGTEAGASTAAIIYGRSEATEFTVDRPFAYAVRDTASGALVFLGVMIDPT